LQRRVPVSARVITVANHKGGVAKSTTVHNLGVALTLMDKSVLLIDLDPQMNLSQTLSLPNWDENRNLFYALAERKIPLSSLIQSTKTDRLDLISGTELLRLADVEFFRKYDSARLLAKALTKAILEDYDVVLIDTPPALNILTVNALTCSNYVIIPMRPDMYSLFGISFLLDEINEIHAEVNSSLEILGILITNFDRRTRVQRDVAEQIRNAFQSRMFKTEIGVNVAIQSAQADGKSILEYDSRLSGAKDYRALAEEVITRAAI